MKRITFEVVSLKEGKIAKLIKEVDKVACNIEIDFDRNVIVLSDLNEDMLEESIDLVNSCYKSISKIKIDKDDSSNKKSTVKEKKTNTLKTKNVVKGNETKKAENTVKKEYPENAESAIRKTFKTAFDKIDKGKTREENLNSFLDEIGLDKTAPYVFKSFRVATKVKKINYESILLELKKDTKNLTEDEIKSELRKTFDEYISKYPELKEKYPKISIMNFIKVYAKTVFDKCFE